LINLTLKMDRGLQAIDQLSQLLMLLVTELQDSRENSERSSGLLLPDSPLPEVLLHQLSSIRQNLLQDTPPVNPSTKRSQTLPKTMSQTLPQSMSQDVQDHQLVGDHEIVSAHTLVSDHEFSALHHKDVLEDHDSFGLDDGINSSLPTDMQVRRLMAQLTAAYNRIAALEEQLLFSHRPSYASPERG
ncbi:MAG: hypothetical protein RLZZ435_2811, partial [Cyanobacteriota bacterium]